jgi:DNA-binding IclR family transcriptional regulator
VLPTEEGILNRDALTEQIVDFLAEFGAASSKDLSEKLRVPLSDVRQKLLEIEKLGIVYRTGQTRGTRWWLG